MVALQANLGGFVGLAGGGLRRDLGCSLWVDGYPVQANAEPEGRTLAWLTVHADLAAHHADQTLADRQAKAGATVFPGRRVVSLLE